VAPAPARILDVGCAQGTLGLLLAEVGYSVTLLDIRPQSIAYARARYERGDVTFLVGRLSEELPPQCDYDVVVCTELLEHVRAPGDLLSLLRDKLKPGGTLLLTTPNARYRLSRLPTFGTADQAVIDRAEPDSMDGDAHRYLYTREDLITLVRGVGLRVQRVGFFSPFWIEGHLKTRYLHQLTFRFIRRPIEWMPKGTSDSLLARWTRAAQWLLATRPK
jgi:SAM-dependent methyltransferase